MSGKELSFKYKVVQEALPVKEMCVCNQLTLQIFIEPYVIYKSACCALEKETKETNS